MMAPDEKKQCCQTLPQDMLSNLPKNVLDDILVHLPLQDAVKTSILSKKWRYNWCKLPELKVDRASWREKDSTSDTSNFRKIIYHILTHHTGPIAKFNLSLPFEGCPNIESADIDNVICFLSRHAIEHLVLSLPGMDMYKLPSSFFTCLQLRDLTLRNCLIVPPPTFKGFERLNSLELFDVRISSRVLERLITNSCWLEKLIVNIPDVCGVIEINAPMLKSFQFEGRLRFLCFKHVPLLSDLSLSDSEYFGTDWEAGRDIVKFFQPLSALEHLSVASMWCLSQGPGLAPTRFPFNLNSVKHFSLCVYLSRLDEVSLTLCLIRSFPYLQYMEIELNEEEDEDDEKEELPALECLELESFSDVTFDHLRKVELRNILGTERYFQLIQLLLAKSPVLERMLIEIGVDDELGAVEIQESVSKFERASPSVEVVFE